MLHSLKSDDTQFGFWPSSHVDGPYLTKNRTKHNMFTWNPNLSSIVLNPESAIVEAFPYTFNAIDWWVWGTQPQRQIPEEANLDKNTHPQWWPFTHYWWKCFLVDTDKVEIGYLEPDVINAEVVERPSSTEVIVKLPNNHKLTSGIYGVSLAGPWERRSVDIVVNGEYAHLSGGEGNSYPIIGGSVLIQNYLPAVDYNHFWRAGMQLFTYWATPQKLQPHFALVGSSMTPRTIYDVSGTVLQLTANIRSSLIPGTRPPNNSNSSQHFWGDHYYVKSTTPPRQVGTVLTRTEDERGGVISFPGGHNFYPGDVITSPTCQVINTTPTEIMVHMGNYPHDATFTAPGQPITVYLINWPYNAHISQQYWRRKFPPNYNGNSIGEFSSTVGPPLFALSSNNHQFAYDINNIPAEGIEIEFKVAYDRVWDPEDEEVKVLNIIPRGESIQVWFDDIYIEFYRLTEEEQEEELYPVNPHTWSTAIKDNAGKLLSAKVYWTPTGGGLTTFRARFSPSHYFENRWLVGLGLYNPAGSIGAYTEDAPTGNISVNRSDGEQLPLLEAKVENVYSRTSVHYKGTYLSRDGLFITVQLPENYVTPPGDYTRWWRFELKSGVSKTYQNYWMQLLPHHGSADGKFTEFMSPTEGIFSLTNITNLIDGHYSGLNIRWAGEGFEAKGRFDVYGVVEGGTLHFFGGRGDELEDPGITYSSASGPVDWWYDDDDIDILVGSDAGLSAGCQTGSVTWAGGARHGVYLTIYSDLTVAIGGTGDPFPGVGTTVTVTAVDKEIDETFRVFTAVPDLPVPLTYGQTVVAEIIDANKAVFEADPIEPHECEYINLREYSVPGVPDARQLDPVVGGAPYPWGYKVTISGLYEFFEGEDRNGEYTCTWQQNRVNGEWAYQYLEYNDAEEEEELKVKFGVQVTPGGGSSAFNWDYSLRVDLIFDNVDDCTTCDGWYPGNMWFYEWRPANEEDHIWVHTSEGPWNNWEFDINHCNASTYSVTWPGADYGYAPGQLTMPDGSLGRFYPVPGTNHWLNISYGDPEEPEWWSGLIEFGEDGAFTVVNPDPEDPLPEDGIISKNTINFEIGPADYMPDVELHVEILDHEEVEEEP